MVNLSVVILLLDVNSPHCRLKSLWHNGCMSQRPLSFFLAIRAFHFAVKEQVQFKIWNWEQKLECFSKTDIQHLSSWIISTILSNVRCYADISVRYKLMQSENIWKKIVFTKITQASSWYTDIIFKSCREYYFDQKWSYCFHSVISGNAEIGVLILIH